MSRRPIHLGPHTFQSKAEAKQYIRGVIARHSDEERIAWMDDLVLREFVALHPNAAHKQGCGIAHFVVRTDPQWGTTRHVVIVRTDGSETDVSLLKCIDGDTHRAKVLHALRCTVAKQVIAFKLSVFSNAQAPPICPYTNERLSMDSAHVDHTPPATFLALADQWMQRCGVSCDDIALTGPTDNQYGDLLCDATCQASWEAFHQAHACLRIISRVGNLSYAKRQHNADRKGAQP